MKDYCYSVLSHLGLPLLAIVRWYKMPECSSTHAKSGGGAMCGDKLTAVSATRPQLRLCLCVASCEVHSGYLLVYWGSVCHCGNITDCRLCLLSYY
jgi:hypothetical protein